MNVLGYLAALFETAVFGDTSLETRQVESLHEIPIRVRIGPFSFSMTDQEKDDVYRDGKDSARDFFLSYVGPQNPAKVKGYLKTAHSVMCKAMNHDGHLRVNVMRPVGNEKLQVIYSHNMDDDYDDRLSLPIESGACGECWRIRQPVICDLEDAATTYNTRWKMSKYDQRLVRETLKSLLSVPIFDQSTLNANGQVVGTTRMIGILNFDSDERIIGPRKGVRATKRCQEPLFDDLWS